MLRSRPHNHAATSAVTLGRRNGTKVSLSSSQRLAPNGCTPPLSKKTRSRNDATFFLVITLGALAVALLALVRIGKSQKDMHFLSEASQRNFPAVGTRSSMLRAASLPAKAIALVGGEFPTAPLPRPRPPDGKGTYDVAILGSGPAGLTAAIFAARAGLSVIVLGSESGLLAETPRLDNFPSWGRGIVGGVPQDGDSVEGGVNERSRGDVEVHLFEGGPGWLSATREQGARFGATFAPPGLLATGITRTVRGEGKRKDFVLDLPQPIDAGTDQSALRRPPYRARSVIIATGASPRRLGLLGEDLLWGRSVHNCAVCDGPLYAGLPNPTVAVVGGGDAAVDAAIFLSSIVKHVVVIHRRMEFRASNVAAVEMMSRVPNIEVLTPYEVTRWEAKKDDPSHLEIVHLVRNENIGGDAQGRTVQCDGAFVMIGSNPNTEFLVNGSGVDLDDEGLVRLVPGDGQATSVHGIFAAGEVVDKVYRQAVTAAGDGARAAIDAERWLRQNGGVPGTTTEIAKQKKEGTGVATLRTHAQVAADTKHFKTLYKDEDTGRNNGAKEDCNLTDIQCIEQVVLSHPVVVFSKPWCPYCKKALEALSLEGVSSPHVIDLAAMGKEGRNVQKTLQNMTGRRTVPNVFISGSSIGGGDETVAMHQSGQLRIALLNAGAIS